MMYMAAQGEYAGKGFVELKPPTIKQCGFCGHHDALVKSDYPEDKCRFGIAAFYGTRGCSYFQSGGVLPEVYVERDRLMPDICPETERIWRCDCGGPHFVHVIRHEWEGGGAYFGLEDYSGPLGWYERIGEAWKSLMGQQHPWSELILTPQIAREIAAELEAAAAWLEGHRGG